MKRMASTQVSLYAGRYQAITIGLAVVLIYLGFAVMTNTILKIVLIALGCYSFSLFLFPRMNQLKAVKSAFGNSFPKCEIWFKEDRFEVETVGTKTVPYSEINRLLITRRDYYIETKDRTLICVPRKLITDHASFQDELSNVTGRRWMKPRLGLF